MQIQDTANGNGVYAEATDTTVITVTTGGLAPDTHIGELCVFGHSGEAYRIIDNDAGTITVDGEASGELTDDTVSIAQDYEVLETDTVNGNGVYTLGTDRTVLTLDTGGLTVDAHIGDVCVFIASGERYTIVDNAAGTITVDGDASAELTDDAVRIAETRASKWDSEWEIIYKATYNYFFVLQDHSGGIHNPGYAVGLLRSAYADLTGGAHTGVDYAP